MQRNATLWYYANRARTELMTKVKDGAIKMLEGIELPRYVVDHDDKDSDDEELTDEDLFEFHKFTDEEIK